MTDKDQMPDVIYARPDTYEGVWNKDPDGYANEQSYIRQSSIVAPDDLTTEQLNWFEGWVTMNANKPSPMEAEDWGVMFDTIPAARELLRLKGKSDE